MIKIITELYKSIRIFDVIILIIYLTLLLIIFNWDAVDKIIKS
jgi:hypothetical protein